MKHSASTRADIMQQAREIDPDVISRVFQNKWALAGIGATTAGTGVWIGVNQWGNIGALLDNAASRPGDASGDMLLGPWGFEVFNPSNFKVENFDELLALDLTEPSNRQRAVDAVMDWRTNMRKQAAESAFNNMQRQVALNTGFDFARAVNDFGNVALGGQSQIPHTFGELTQMAQWQGIQGTFNSIGSTIDAQANAYLQRLDIEREIQEARKGANDGILVTQVLRTAQGSIERADELLRPSGEALLSPAEYRAAASRSTAHRDELFALSRQLQQISDERSDSLDPAARERLNGTMSTVQERIRELDRQVNNFHALATNLHLALEAERRASDNEARADRAENRAERGELRDLARRAISEGDAAIANWNANSGTVYTIQGLEQARIQLPFNDVILERLDSYAKANPVAGSLEGAMGISHLSYLRALDARNPRWVDAVVRHEDEPLTAKEREIVRDELFRRVSDADRAAGRLIQVEPAQIERLLGPQGRSTAPIVPGMVADRFSPEAAVA